MRRRPIHVLVILSLLPIAHYGVQAQDTPTPTPAIQRYGDFDDSKVVDRDDITSSISVWNTTGDKVDTGPSAVVRGTLTLSDECGNCVETPEDVWVFLTDLTGMYGTFCTLASYGEYRLEGIPYGTYRLVVGNVGGKYGHAVREEVGVGSPEVVRDVCLARKVDVQECPPNCPRGNWNLEMWSAENGSGTGTMTFYENGTFQGPVDYVYGDYKIKVTLTGEFRYDTDCAFVMENIIITPRDGGGDCDINGVMGAVGGKPVGNCEAISALWTGTFSSNCEELSGDDGGTMTLTPAGSEAPKIDAQRMPADSSMKVLISDYSTDYDLNLDGKIDAKDTLLLLDQWHLRIPDGPTLPPVPTCTPIRPTATEGPTGPTETPEATPTPSYPEGLWLFTWRIAVPFKAVWTSEILLGNPGAVEQFNSPQLYGVSASYTYDPETRLFTLDVTGTTTEGEATVTFQATGHVNEAGTEINDGTFTGTIQVGQQTPVPFTGTFTAVKCDGPCPEQKSIEGWWDLEWTLVEPTTMAGTKWHTAIYFDNTGNIQEFQSGDLEQVTVSYTLDQQGNFSLEIQAQTQLGQAVSLTASCNLNTDYTVMENGQFQGTIVVVRDEKTLSGTFTGAKCPNGPCDPWW